MSKMFRYITAVALAGLASPLAISAGAQATTTPVATTTTTCQPYVLNVYAGALPAGSPALQPQCRQTAPVARVTPDANGYVGVAWTLTNNTPFSAPLQVVRYYPSTTLFHGSVLGSPSYPSNSLNGMFVTQATHGQVLTLKAYRGLVTVGYAVVYVN